MKLKKCTIRSLVISRLWVRLMLFVNNLSHDDNKKLEADLDLLYSYVEIILKRHSTEIWYFKIDPRFNNYRYYKEFRTNLQGEKRRPDTNISGMFLYSIMDYIRTLEVENNEECPYDLGNFARITDVIYNFTLNLNKRKAKC